MTTRSHSSLGNLELRVTSNHHALLLYGFKQVFSSSLSVVIYSVCSECSGFYIVQFLLSFVSFEYVSKTFFLWKISHLYFILSTCMILVVNLDPCSI